MNFPALDSHDLQRRAGAFPWGYVDDLVPAADWAALRATFLHPASHPAADTLGRGKQRIAFSGTPARDVADAAGAEWAAAIHEIGGRDFRERLLSAVRPLCADVAANTSDPDEAAVMRARCTLTADDLHMRFEFSSMADGAWLPPHTDAPDKIVSLVLYVDGPEDGTTGEAWDPAFGGQTEVYVPLDPTRRDNWGSRTCSVDEMEVVEAVPFLDNRLFWFVKTARSWHGVRPVTSPAGQPRLSFNYSLTIGPEAMARPALAEPTERLLAREAIVFA